MARTTAPTASRAAERAGDVGSGGDLGQRLVRAARNATRSSVLMLTFATPSARGLQLVRGQARGAVQHQRDGREGEGVDAGAGGELLRSGRVGQLCCGDGPRNVLVARDGAELTLDPGAVRAARATGSRVNATFSSNGRCDPSTITEV